MRRLDARTFITLTSGFPVKGGTWDHLQNSYNEQIRDLLISRIGIQYSTSIVYIVWGCVVTTVSSTSTITEGCVFYNGELYHVSGNTTPAVGSGLVHVFDLDAFYVTATDSDPVKYTDGTDRNVHLVRNAKLSTKASGSGTLTGGTSGDYTAAITIGSWTDVSATPSLSPSVSGTTFTVVSKTYNRFRIDGRTVIWQCCIDRFNTTGSASNNGVLYVTYPAELVALGVIPKNINSYQGGSSYKGYTCSTYIGIVSGSPVVAVALPPNQTYWSIATNQQLDLMVTFEF